MKTLLMLSALIAGSLHGEEALIARPADLPVVSAVPARTLWRASVAALAVANVLDVHSSWGKRELNPMLAGQAGHFGGQGALIKLGLQGGLFGIEWLITRRNPNGRLYRALSAINFGASGVIAGTAMHNYQVPRPR
jgi:hypothetical protein